MGNAASNGSNIETSGAGEAPPNHNATSNFLEALKSLSRPEIDVLESGIERAKDKLSLVMRQVQNFLDLRTIVCAGPFLYAGMYDVDMGLVRTSYREPLKLCDSGASLARVPWYPSI